MTTNNDNKLTELLNAHSEAIKKYLKEKESFRKIEGKYDKETHQQYKTALEELKKDLEAKEKEEKKYLVEYKKKLKEKDKYSKEELADVQKNKELILAVQKESNGELAKAIEEEKALYKASTTEWDNKWKTLRDKTQNYTDIANKALTNMFGNITKNIDQDINNKKQEVTELTKKIGQAQKDLTKIQTDSANDVARARAVLIENEGNKLFGDPEQLNKDLAKVIAKQIPEGILIKRP